MQQFWNGIFFWDKLFLEFKPRIQHALTAKLLPYVLKYGGCSSHGRCESTGPVGVGELNWARDAQCGSSTCRPAQRSSHRTSRPTARLPGPAGRATAENQPSMSRHLPCRCLLWISHASLSFLTLSARRRSGEEAPVCDPGGSLIIIPGCLAIGCLKQN